MSNELSSGQDPKALRSLLESATTDSRKTRGEFMIALTNLIASGPRTGERPSDPVRMVVALYALWIDVSTDGLWKYFEEWGVGASYSELQGWCRRIGAESTVAYLDAAAALFPDRAILVSDERRREFVAQLGRRGSKDPLAQLDRDYRDKVDAEIPECLLAYLNGNPVIVEAWVARKQP